MLKYRIGLLLLLTACKSFHEISTLPSDKYHLKPKYYPALVDTVLVNKYKKIKVFIELIQDTLQVTPLSVQKNIIKVKLTDIDNFRFHRHTFDVDVFTIPFKIRPANQGFPTQLNPNFSGTLYLGRRHDCYRIKATPQQPRHPVKLTGVGYGYGGILGIGGVTMNPFVTQNAITYEYDGLVLTGGLAGIYDAKKFNLGLAIGTDYLLDKNKHAWIYQGKPWLGVLFGINLN